MAISAECRSKFEALHQLWSHASIWVKNSKVWQKTLHKQKHLVGNFKCFNKHISMWLLVWSIVRTIDLKSNEIFSLHQYF